MGKGTLIAVAVCLIILIVGTMFQTNNAAAVKTSAEVVENVQDNPVVNSNSYCKATVDSAKAETFKYETDLFEIVFDTKGASIKSLTMKEHANADGEHVDLIFKGKDDHNAFLTYWGDDLTQPIDDIFVYEVAGDKVIFKKSYVANNGTPFDLIKTFEFREGEYLFAVHVEIEAANDLGFGDYEYSIGFEPQVGPEFGVLKNNNYDYRRIYANLIKDNGKLKKSTISYKDGEFYTVKHMKWFALTGKYFAAVALPENSDKIAYKYTAFQGQTDEVSQTNSFFVSVPEKNSTIYFYCGPQLKSYLKSYYNGSDNAWGLRNTELDRVLEGGSAISWLENILKWCLKMIHKVVPNYGICIIILTILLKFALWPLTKKSTESTSKMSQLQPLVQEVQKKYPDNPQKQNLEMQALYKKYGVSPLGGCLPMLIQFPILIAFYGLLNKHFELRGAMFIPGWIPDLSLPDVVATLGFRIPLLGNEIHLMPLIYTVSMIYSMKISQTSQPNSQQQSSMKFMTYGMPIMFFFILYSAPSGLFVYWTCQNILTILQQITSNKKMKTVELKPLEAKDAEKEPEAIRKYKEKLARLEEESKKNNKKGK